MTRQDDIAAARARAHAVLGIYPGGKIYLGIDYADPGSLTALMVMVNEEIVATCSIPQAIAPGWGPPYYGSAELVRAFNREMSLRFDDIIMRVIMSTEGA